MAEPNIKGSKAGCIDDYRISNAKKVNAKRFPNGCIYIITLYETDYYKIGVSQKPDRRISDLSNATPFEVLVIYCKYFMDVYSVETRIHEIIKDKYIKNEWFKLDLMDVFDIMQELDIEDKAPTQKQLNLF